MTQDWAKEIQSRTLVCYPVFLSLFTVNFLLAVYFKCEKRWGALILISSQHMYIFAFTACEQNI